MIYHASACLLAQHSQSNFNLNYIQFSLLSKMWMCNIKSDFSWVHTRVMHFWFIERAQFFFLKIFLLTMSYMYYVNKMHFIPIFILLRCARAPPMTTVWCKPCYLLLIDLLQKSWLDCLSWDKNDSLLLFFVFVCIFTLRMPTQMWGVRRKRHKSKEIVHGL